MATPGAIAYVSYDRVIRDRLTAVALRNKAGVFVTLSKPRFQAAVKVSSISKSAALTASLIDTDGPNVWRLTDLTHILLDTSPKTAERANASAQFFYWAFLKRNILINGSGFAAWPTEVQAMVVRKLGEIKPLDGKKLNFTRWQADSLSAHWVNAQTEHNPDAARHRTL